MKMETELALEIYKAESYGAPCAPGPIPDYEVCRILEPGEFCNMIVSI